MKEHKNKTCGLFLVTSKYTPRLELATSKPGYSQQPQQLTPTVTECITPHEELQLVSGCKQLLYQKHVLNVH